MSVLGIDPGSTKLAMALIEGSKWRLWEFKLPSPYSPQNAFLASQHISEVLSDSIFDTAFMEAPVVSRGGVQSTMKQAFVSGAIQATLLDWDVPVYLVPVSSWKKEVVGKGNATKDEVREFGSGFLPKHMTQSQDAVDAALIAVYGQQVLERSA